MRTTRLLPLLMAAAAESGVLTPTAAVADQLQQTERHPLFAVAGAPLDRGTVVVTHANGPVIYGQDRFHLIGAQPSTTYAVTLTLYADPLFGSLTCDVPAAAFPAGTVVTNGAGNGHGKATFYAQDVPEVSAPLTVTARWTLISADGVVYSTGCHELHLDETPPR